MSNKTIRVLLAKVGCDIHERGALTLLTVLRDEGMEVIYTGRYQTEEAVARAAVAEDVDVIAVSDLSGSLPIITREIFAHLKKLDAADIPLIAGGLLTEDDANVMKAQGVIASFGTGSRTDAFVECIKKLASGK